MQHESKGLVANGLAVDADALVDGVKVRRREGADRQTHVTEKCGRQGAGGALPVGARDVNHRVVHLGAADGRQGVNNRLQGGSGSAIRRHSLKVDVRFEPRDRVATFREAHV